MCRMCWGGVLVVHESGGGGMAAAGGREGGREARGGAGVALGPDLVQFRGGEAAGCRPAGRRRARFFC